MKFSKPPQRDYDAERRALVQRMALNFQDEVRAHLASLVPTPQQVENESLLASIVAEKGPIPTVHTSHVMQHVAAFTKANRNPADFNEQVRAFNARLNRK